MKFKGLTKIALAGAAVAVTAGTLATSTYAWYVTNNTATAKNITIVTQSGDGGNLLLDQSNGSNTDTRTGDAVTTLQLTSNNVAGANLVPTTPVKMTAADAVTDATTFATAKAAGTLYTFASDVYTHVTGDTAYDSSATYMIASAATTAIDAWVDAQGAIQTTPYIEFKIWVNNTTAETVTINAFKVVNTTTSVTKQTVYSRNGLPSAVGANDTTFAVDAADALRIGVMNSTYTEATGSGNGTIDKTANWTIYDKTIFTEYTVTNAATLDFVSSADGDANNYYYKILKEVPFGCTASGTENVTVSSPSDPSATFTSVTTAAANQYNVLTFRVWLEGTDSACFDTCRGQTFTFEITFGKSNS